MNYSLSRPEGEMEKRSFWSAIKKLASYAHNETWTIIWATITIIITSALNLIAPLLVGYTIDTAIRQKDFSGVLLYAVILLGLYALAFATNYIQMMMMGGVGQRLLFTLRNAIFTKLQSLPIAFFQANRSGDLISRINNDTDKLSQFFSEILMRFLGNVFIMAGAAIFLIAIHPSLGIAALIPAILATIFTKLISPWVKERSARSLRATGGLSAEIQEDLEAFKVMVVFQRQAYLHERFQRANERTYAAALASERVNSVFIPTYDLAANVSQLAIVAYGAYLFTHGQMTVGIVISFLLYANRFYQPFRQLASLWSSLQLALAGWDRVADILSLTSNLETTKPVPVPASDGILTFHDVSFQYPEGKEVLKHVNLTLKQGKTYALVGPTGGGKTTTASLMARLYDVTSGIITLDGQDIRSVDDVTRTHKVGFILQEPFLFTGTVRENLVYGHEKHGNATKKDVLALLKKHGLEALLKRLPDGLDTEIKAGQDVLSLGQRQLIAFMRAVLREPDVLILDEATANIDTVTEQLLEEILASLPQKTTKVVIAHRLNTIKNADEIFFVNNGEIIAAGSFDHAVELLMHDKRKS
ncbi:ABC transporter ATP-binding protein [Patescibacteria group bacterium]|nr:ABC transporter ATP-binding protein [Patescibacteria group bacterium]